MIQVYRQGTHNWQADAAGLVATGSTGPKAKRNLQENMLVELERAAEAPTPFITAAWDFIQVLYYRIGDGFCVRHVDPDGQEYEEHVRDAASNIVMSGAEVRRLAAKILADRICWSRLKPPHVTAEDIAKRLLTSGTWGEWLEDVAEQRLRSARYTYARSLDYSPTEAHYYISGAPHLTREQKAEFDKGFEKWVPTSGCVL